TAPDRLNLADQDQWGAPLGQLIRRALAQDLQARLAPGTLILPGAPRPAGARALVVNVIEFQPGTDGRVRLQASWTLMAGKPLAAVLTRDASLVSEGPTTGGQSQAAAMSALLGELSDRIAASLAGA
ncbi:MAG: PqiC family protein, partial [Caulobacteraceae bacterium]